MNDNLGPQFKTVMHPVADLMKLHDPGANDPYVTDYAEDMRSGKWDGSHPEEPVNIATWNDGHRFLLDGSHRTLAAHEAGISHLPTLIEHHDEPAPEWVHKSKARRAEMYGEKS